MRLSHRAAMWEGVRLGVYKGNALAGPPGALIMLFTGHWVMAAMLLVGSIIAWAGWERDFGLKWNPWKESK